MSGRGGWPSLGEGWALLSQAVTSPELGMAFAAGLVLGGLLGWALTRAPRPWRGDAP
jgi:hypothetical protein